MSDTEPRALTELRDRLVAGIPRAARRQRGRRLAGAALATVVLAGGGIAAAVGLTRDEPARVELGGEDDAPTTTGVPTTLPLAGDPVDPAAFGVCPVAGCPIVSTDEGFVAYLPIAQIPDSPTGTTIATSPDGITWTDITGTFPQDVFVRVAGHADGLHYVAGDRDDGTPIFASSTDLVEWDVTELDLPANPDDRLEILARIDGAAVVDGRAYVSSGLTVRPDLEALGYDPSQDCGGGSDGTSYTIRLCTGEEVTLELPDLWELRTQRLLWRSTDDAFELIDGVGPVTGTPGGLVAVRSEPGGIRVIGSTSGSAWRDLGLIEPCEGDSGLTSRVVASGSTLLLPGYCGDTGTVWVSDDGGESFTALPLPVPVPEGHRYGQTNALAGPYGFAVAGRTYGDPEGPDPAARGIWTHLVSPDGRDWTTVIPDQRDGASVLAVGDDELLVVIDGVVRRVGLDGSISAPPVDDAPPTQSADQLCSVRLCTVLPTDDGFVALASTLRSTDVYRSDSGEGWDLVGRIPDLTTTRATHRNGMTLATGVVLRGDDRGALVAATSSNHVDWHRTDLLPPDDLVAERGFVAQLDLLAAAATDDLLAVQAMALHVPDLAALGQRVDEVCDASYSPPVWSVFYCEGGSATFDLEPEANSSTTVLWTSTDDGATWEALVMDSPVAIGATPNALIRRALPDLASVETSTDGVTWTPAGSFAECDDGANVDLIRSDDATAFVGFCGDEPAAWTSTGDGSTWQRTEVSALVGTWPSGATRFLGGSGGGPGGLVFGVGHDAGEGDTSFTLYSPDGLTWSRLDGMPEDAQLLAVGDDEVLVLRDGAIERVPLP